MKQGKARATPGKAGRRAQPVRPAGQIGVIVPAQIELGRAVLRGARAWCNEHAGTRLALISSHGGYASEAFSGLSLDCVVLQDCDPRVIAAVQAHCPHVVVTSNRREVDGVARVINDDRAIGRSGAEYFLQRGFRTLAFLQADVPQPDGRRSFHFALERSRGFTAAATAGGARVYLFDHDQPGSAALVRALLALPGPVGVMASSDLHARWLIEAMEEPHKLIPRRIALLGVDDDPLENALSPIGISSVCPAGERIGYEAAALGMRMARGEPPPRQPLLVAPRRIVTRQSTSVFAVDDPLVARALGLMRERMAGLADAADLVQALGVPRRTLEVRFRKALGSSPARELLRTRIQMAGELLATTALSIKEIAYLVGFSEPRMLSRCFLQVTGERPTDYRQRILPGRHR